MDDLRMALGMSWEDAMSVNAELKKKTVIAGLKLWFRTSPSSDVEEIFHVLFCLKTQHANSVGIGFVS